MASNFGNLTRDIFGCNWYVRGTKVMDCDRNMSGIKSATIGTLNVRNGITFNHGQQPIPKYCVELDKDTPVITVGSGMSADIHEVTLIESVITNAVTPVVFPMAGVPLGDLAETATISTTNGLLLTNLSGNGTFSGPWTFVNNIPGETGVVALKCGIDEDYLPGGGGGGGVEPPFDKALSKATITFDTIGFPGQIGIFDLHIGVSSEPNYDYLKVFKNNELLYSIAGQGPDSSDPFIRDSPDSLKDLIVEANDVITVQFQKDGAWYAGVDGAYFYIKNLRVLPEFNPASIRVRRNNVTVFRFGRYINLSESKLNEPQIFQTPFELEANDTINLTFDTAVFDNVKYRICMYEAPLGIEYRDTTNLGTSTFSQIQYDNSLPVDKTSVSGWYESDSATYGCVYIEDKGVSLILTTRNLVQAGRYFLSEGFGQVYSIGTISYTKIGEGAYIGDVYGDILLHNKVTGEFNADFTDAATVAALIQFNGFVPSKLRPVGNPDERFWKYEHDLQDWDHTYFTPLTFYDFCYNYYMTGRSSAFSTRSVPTQPDINPYGLDLTQVKHSFGSATRGEYDSLYNQMRTTGVERRYNVKRFIYWPKCYKLENPFETQGNNVIIVHQVSHPFVNGSQIHIDNSFSVNGIPSTEINTDHIVTNVTADTYEITVSTNAAGSIVGLGGNVIITGITESQQDSLRWYVNQERAGYLGFICDIPNEGEKNFGRFMPGETIQMSGSQTRLDDIELKLSFDGFHTGPKPAKEFVPDYQYDNWSFYTLRLPLVINADNNKLTGQANGDFFSLEIPFGNYYLPQLMDYINEQVPGLFMTILLFTAQLIILGQQSGDYIISPYYVSDSIFASTLLGPKGLDIGYLFNGGNPLVNTEAGGVILETSDSDPLKYTSHTPLTDEEAQLLLDNMSEIQVFTMHGPIRADMPYPNFVACLNELYLATTCEDHSVITPYGRVCENGQIEIFETFEKMNPIINQLIDTLDYNQTWDRSTPLYLFVPNYDLIAVPIRTYGYGHPAEMSEMYKIGDYRDSHTTHDYAKRARLMWQQPKGLTPSNNIGIFQYPSQPVQKTQVTFTSGTYDLSDREVSSTIVNYLEDPLWVVSQQDPDAAPDFSFIPYEQHHTWNTPRARVKVLTAHNPGPVSSYYAADTSDPQDEEEIPFYGLPNSNAVLLPSTDSTDPVATGTSFILADPIDASSALTNASFVAGKTVWIKAHDNFVNKLIVAQNAGALCVVFFNDDPSGDIHIYEELANPALYDFTGTTIPLCIVSRQHGQYITGYTGGNENDPANYQMKTDNTTVHSGIVTNGKHSTIVDGEWTIGIIRDDRVVRSLREQGLIGPTDPAPAKFGYITHHWSSFSFVGDPTQLSWFDQDASAATPISTNLQMAALMAARIIGYFNDAGVNHIICDIRNTTGGSSSVWNAIMTLCGGDRERNGGFGTVGIANNIQNIDPAGVQSVFDGMSLNKYSEDNGITVYQFISGTRTCYPSDWESIVSQGFPSNGFFRGTSPSNQKKLLWYTNSTTISATQDAYCGFKGTSRDTTNFDGDLGNDTKFVGYGCYYRPFSTGGGYDTYLNWYARNRAGEEDIKFGPMWAIDRWDAGRVITVSGTTYPIVEGEPDYSQPSTGGVVKALDQEFSKLHQPHIKWDMNADNFFQDIGYTYEDSNKYIIGAVDASVGPRTNSSSGTTPFSVSTPIAGTSSVANTTDINVAGSNAVSIDGTYFVMYDDSGSVAFWYDSTGSTPQPVAGTTRYVQIGLLSTDTDYEIAQKTQAAIEADAKFSAVTFLFDPYENNCVPWVPRRHPAGSVNFYDPLTWRDTTLEKSFAMLIDPNLETHYYTDDGYGYLN